MKKIIKVILLLILVLSFLCIYTNKSVYAVIDPTTYTPEGSVDKDVVVKYGSNIASALTVIGIVVSVICLNIVGFIFIVSSPSGKAEYQKKLVPIVVGILIMAIITTIVSGLASIGESFNREDNVDSSFIGPTKP